MSFLSFQELMSEDRGQGSMLMINEDSVGRGGGGYLPARLMRQQVWCIALRHYPDASYRDTSTQNLPYFAFTRHCSITSCISTQQRMRNIRS